MRLTWAYRPSVSRRHWGADEVRFAATSHRGSDGPSDLGFWCIVPVSPKEAPMLGPGPWPIPVCVSVVVFGPPRATRWSLLGLILLALGCGSSSPVSERPPAQPQRPPPPV